MYLCRQLKEGANLTHLEREGAKRDQPPLVDLYLTSRLEIESRFVGEVRTTDARTTVWNPVAGKAMLMMFAYGKAVSIM